MLGKKMRHFHRESVRIDAVELVRMFCQFREKDSAAVTNFEQPGGMRAAQNRPDELKTQPLDATEDRPIVPFGVIHSTRDKKGLFRQQAQ